jgi:DNA repair photolyase
METAVLYIENSINRPNKLNTSIIYEPRGRAKEYSELAANLYRGCNHGCKYCYAPSAIRMDRTSFYHATVRVGLLAKLEKDAQYLEKIGEKRTILLCFTTDPYQPLDVREKITRQSIQILHNHGLKISILTKGGARSERDFDLLRAKPDLSEYGITLVFSDDQMREHYEPFTANTEERIRTLKKAHDFGIFTYVSLEPVWEAEQTLKLIDLTHEFVDFFKVGKLNHHPHQYDVNWKKFKEDVTIKLTDLEKNYYLKNDLKML